MKTDKNIKYSDIPFSQYQKRPDVRSWSCYHESNDRHWKRFLWIFNHIKVFYGMQINGNFWLWREKNMPIKPHHLGLKLHKQETLSICSACLPALDACDCREINPFNNLWLKFEDFQFFFRISISSNWRADSFAIQACAGDNGRVGMKRGRDGLIMQRTWKFCLSSLSKGAQLT